MRATLDAAFLTALQDENVKKAMFVDMQFTASLLFTTLDIDYYLDGDKYLSREMRLENLTMQSGLAVDRADLTVANATREMSAILFSGNERGKPVIFHLAAFNDDGTLIGSGQFFYGILNNYEISGDTVTLYTVNEMHLWRKRPLRKTNAGCPWPFGGTECGYGGSEIWCDQTYDRCIDLGNQASFGGEPWLSELQEKQIWWGRAPK